MRERACALVWKSRSSDAVRVCLRGREKERESVCVCVCARVCVKSPLFGSCACVFAWLGWV